MNSFTVVTECIAKALFPFVSVWTADQYQLPYGPDRALAYSERLFVAANVVMLLSLGVTLLFVVLTILHNQKGR